MDNPKLRDLSFAEVTEILSILDAAPRGGKVELRIGDSVLIVQLSGGTEASISPGDVERNHSSTTSAGAAAVPSASAGTRAVSGEQPQPATRSAIAAEPPATNDDAEREGLVAVNAPMTGVFYRAPAPGEAPFVTVGDEVAESDDLAIIEVMKLMNRIGAPCAGVVRAIEAENEQLVEFGRPIMWIQPAESDG